MSLRVLVVDDDEPMRLFVGRVLQDAGHDVAMAASGDDAIAVLTSLTNLDLLITDEVMPRMPGHELARLVRAREPNIRVLYLTGFSDQLFKEKRALWADEAFLDKPCSPKALLEAVSLLMYGALDPDSGPPAEQP
jgi:two-component system cell cycle sensor histidine kinase/response regulator CckA